MALRDDAGSNYFVQNLGQVNSGQVDANGHEIPRHFEVFEIPYEALVPRKADCENLLVPVCISASRVAFSAFRLETQFMIAGQAAGVAAVLAGAGAVQSVDVRQLQAVLEQQAAVLKQPS